MHNFAHVAKRPVQRRVRPRPEPTALRILHVLCLAPVAKSLLDNNGTHKLVVQGLVLFTRQHTHHVCPDHEPYQT